MFEFKKTCDTYEKLSPVERGIILTEKSIKILDSLKLARLPNVDPIDTLVSFIIGSVASDGKIDEREYLLILPSLVRVFGNDYNYKSVKKIFSKGDCKKVVASITDDLLDIMRQFDEEFCNDVITLCLCIVSVDGKISLKEKRYLKRLCKI